MQAVTTSNVPVLPVVHVAHVVGTAAMFAAVGTVAGAVVMLLIPWRGWAWTCGVPLVVAAPFAVVLGWRGEVCHDACAVATVGAAHGGRLTTCEPEATSRSWRGTAWAP